MWEVMLATFQDCFLLADICKKTPNSALWLYKNFEEELKQTYAKIFVVKENNLLLGFCAFRLFLDEAEINNIAILPSNQSKGVGSFLLKQVVDFLVKNNAKTIILEVNENNKKAIRFYTKFGFKQVNIRKKFYNNKEDALILKKIIA